MGRRPGRHVGGRGARRTAWRLLLGALVASPGPVPVAHAETELATFATVPSPGHPVGIAVDDDRVYVSTSAGHPLHFNTEGERVFAYDMKGNLVGTTPIETMPVSNMGLLGLALDGNTGTSHRLYVADMNGRILRIAVNRRPPAPEVFAEVPPPYGLGGWPTAMWVDITFDRAGNGYVTDDKPRLWRITPEGRPLVWFEDPRLASVIGVAGGPAGCRIDPEGKFLYFTVSAAAVNGGGGMVYRLPLLDHPSANDLQEVHRFPAVRPPGIGGLAFGRSGRLYVALADANQIAVLDPHGREERRISSPLLDSPFYLAFLGRSLLVSNWDFHPDEHPDHWKVLQVFVGEGGLPLHRPALP